MDSEYEGSDELDSGEDETFWRASESPVESFSDAEGANEDGEWPVTVVGEEVDSFRNIKYEARWGTWSRPDGTNTTWNNNFLTSDHTRAWTAAQKAIRHNFAKDDLDIEIWTTPDLINTNTRLRAQGYDEKLKWRQRSPVDLPQRMAKLLAEKMNLARGDARGPSSTPSSTPATSGPSLRMTNARRQQTARDSVSSTRSSVTLSSGTAATPASPFTIVSTPPSNTSAAKQKGKAKAVERLSFRSPTNIESTPSSRVVRPLPSRTRVSSPLLRPLLRRERLQKEWSDIARRHQAAAITFANEIDDDEVPPLPLNFRYIESEYIYSRDVPQVQDDDCFVRCECGTCHSAVRCGCQEPSDVVDEYERKDYAYTPEGLFAFNVPLGAEVIECNKFCSCNSYSCPNRVAQLPRDIPVEVFKTPDRGWGVRATTHVEKGKVLGIYTGLLMRREAAEELSGEEKAYCFDLDGQDDGVAEDSYSVDSKRFGNWTRFINHSCSPNICVYLVVYDTIPGTNMPYIAFVATQDIPSRTEFTFDYDPSAAREKVKGKGKGKAKIPPGAKPCMCGAGGCRGWMRV